MRSREVIRLPEWSERSVANLTPGERLEIQQSAQLWAQENRLPAPPLTFSGANGESLCTRNFVGAVEAGGHSIEIYPKLDRSLIGHSRAILPMQSRTVMASLMWMLEVAQHEEIFEADVASLQSAPSSFLDLWAKLLVRHLSRELESGVARAYCPQEDNATTVRGRILFGQHITHNFNRPDRAYCRWDEFSADRPLNRVLKCACKFLGDRVNDPETRRLLFVCITILDEVQDVDVATALREAERIVWDRSMQRFQLPFKLAVRLLQSIGHESFHGGQQTYVFLLDMNQVFEDYVHAVLERVHQVPVTEQKRIGTLFKSPNRIAQKPDFYWKKRDGSVYIADSKYKPFFDWHSDDGNGDIGSEYFEPNDVRQLICYGLMDPAPPEKITLQIIYPFAGEGPLPKPIRKQTFKGMMLEAVPIRVHRSKCWAEVTDDALHRTDLLQA